MKSTVDRIERDELMMRIAALISQRGTCLRASVGAVIAIDGRIISTGYVGSPAGFPHCIDVGCDTTTGSGCLRTVHAEANAVAFAARNGIATAGATIYCTHSPCRDCAKLIINSGIHRLFYEQAYRDETPIGILAAAGIEVVHYAA